MRPSRASADAGCRVLVPLATPLLYGLERAVIETFDAVRPDITPLIVQSHAVFQRRPPIIDELERRGLSFSLLPDGDGWPTLGRPRSVGEFARMLVALVEANAYYAAAVGKADALYVTSPRAAWFTMLAAARCRLAKARVIHHFHELPDRPLPRAWTRLVTDCIHNSAVGRDLALRGDPRIRSKRHAVLPPVVDAETHSETSPLRRTGTTNIVYVGQVSLHKGIDLLIDAFGRLAARHPDVVLHLVGGCAESFAAQLRSLCERSGAAERIEHWGYRTDALAFLRDACICVQPTPPSRCRESFGRTVVEAMAFGVPTVCLGSGALKEIVVHGETGLVCAEDPGALAASIERFLDDAVFRRMCGEACRQRYQARYSPRVVRAMWLEFLAGDANRLEAVPAA